MQKQIYVRVYNEGADDESMVAANEPADLVETDDMARRQEFEIYTCTVNQRQRFKVGLLPLDLCTPAPECQEIPPKIR